MTQPNFFIVGAPKCGTTAVCEYLRSHPQVFMCTPKEPHYFATDFPRYRVVTGWDDYLGLFSAQPHQTIVGEASVFYLYSEVALSLIRQKLPASRLLVMLRNPVELAVSMHAQAFHTGDENQKDYFKAWKLCEERRAGLKIPRTCRDRKVLFYDEISLLGRQLDRALSLFPHEQVMWCFLEDLATDTLGVYNQILLFLELERVSHRDFPRINQRKKVHSGTLTRFVHAPPPVLRNMAMHLKEILGIERWGVLDFLDTVNTAGTMKPAKLPTRLREKMIERFEPDIRLLEKLTKRNLSHWITGDASL